MPKRSLPFKVSVFSGAVVVVAIVSIPMIWALITSLKFEASAVSYPPSLVPDPLTLSNYAAVLRHATLVSDLLNSIYYSLGAVVLSLAVGVPAGYAAARFEFRGKKPLMLAILATSMVPGVALIVPTYLLLDRMDLLNNHGVMILILASRLIPQTIWFSQNFVAALPIEVEEAGFVDGASRFVIFRRIVLPLLKPGIAAIAVLGVITTWNDYVTVAVFAPDVSARTIQVALVNQVFDAIGISWSYFMAFAIAASIPVVVLFMLGQRWFVAGLTAGTVKG